jgi:hypothetical protein
MNTDLRKRLLAAALAVIHMLSNHPDKTPDRIFTPDRAQGLHECKLYANYLIPLDLRN